MKIKILDDLKIPYALRYNQKAKISIKVNPLGKVNISVPRLAREIDVNNTIERSIDWINETRKRVILPRREFISGEEYLFLGKNYSIEVINSKYEKVYLANDKLYLYTSSDDLGHKAKIVGEWLREMVEITFSEMFDKCFAEVGPYLKSYPELLIKRYRSRWGCCYHLRNKIILNNKLIHLPLYLIRYIIIHEMSHLVFPNHSENFHRFVQKFVPNEKICQKELKKYSIYYE